MAEKRNRKNFKEPGRGIFCQGLDLSKEHIFADWLRDFIPREMLEHKTRKAHVHPLKGTQASVERRAGDPHSRRIRCVCQTCNNGWMSHLQEQARPFLVPMLIGETTSLHRRGQATLAAWITVMVMVSEFVDRDMVAVSQADRAFVRERRKAPNHWRIWIGAHERAKFPPYTHNVLELVEKKPEEVPDVPPTALNTQTTTICLGKNLIIHVMSSAVAKRLIRKWRLPRLFP